MKIFTSICLWILATGVSQANSNDLTLNITGELAYPVPCKFSSDTVEVDFGDNVHHNAVDGVRYEQVLETLDCSAAAVNTLKIRFVGEGAEFDSEVLNTTHADLAIEIRQDGSKLANGEWLNFTATPPRLSAVPIVRPGRVLTPGPFTATATLEVDYQ
ncbi:fimbrial protein [Enterobacter roggenkampii]|jgi:type 1 fimbria pilin|uniref:MrfE protein n=1 Tax=Enterobacter roggenkampii TaxID=1812935 RepID=A0ABD7KCA8_9ENTR|nr:fimbrial protein [Enterobacter roggenkampii]RWS72959.1 fimbrial protein [Enterobacter cloacae]MCB7499529.1 fimbrial protein [Enterobacter roggenkampii]MCE5965768.1 fimbrial protein [Enterobacter roggenkampii]MCE5970200.1 fimbrial protein [Enterobacter roggenkampii]UHY21919.1 fimbrial protein [Enterobacter roggenkampii]